MTKKLRRLAEKKENRNSAKHTVIFCGYTSSFFREPAEDLEGLGEALFLVRFVLGCGSIVTLLLTSIEVRNDSS